MRKLRSILKSTWAFLSNPSPGVKTLGWLLLLLAFFAAASLFLWPFLQNAMKPQTFDDRKQVVILFAQGLGIAGLFVTLIFTYLRLRAAERTIQISQEGQITDRFTRAIQQLGDPKLEVRLGGIYALERIARDSPRDHWTIMEVLTAYVRENAPWKGDPASGNDSDIKPRTDIQAILTVIGRRPEKQRKAEPTSLDLNNTDLRRVPPSGTPTWRMPTSGTPTWRMPTSAVPSASPTSSLPPPSQMDTPCFQTT